MRMWHIMLSLLMNMWVSMKMTAVLVDVDMKEAAFGELAKCVDSQADQHQADTELQRQGRSFIDLKVKDDHHDAGDQE